MKAFFRRLWSKIISRWDVLALKWFKKTITRYVANPLRKYPRNLSCWCGSKKKAKTCCLPGQPKTLPRDLAKVAHGYMKYIDGQR